MARFRSPPPSWYRVVVVALILWGGMGLWSFYEHVAHGPAAMGNVPTEYDRRYFEGIPSWYNWVFGVATWGGLAASVALLLRRGVAVALAAASVVAITVMFGWTFLATDLIASKGAWVTYFPALIFIIGVFQLWLADQARRRGWIK